MKYHQLTQAQRYQLDALLALKMSKTEIARKLCVHRSTVYRELKRNKITICGPIYDAFEAIEVTKGRRKSACQNRRKVAGKILVYVRRKLEMKWSPEQIAGRMKSDRRKTLVSYSSIYRFIHDDAEDLYEGEKLYQYLRRYILSRHRKVTHCRLPDGLNGKRLGIRERSKCANERREVGHFERDLMEGKRGKKAINVIVDRKSRYTMLGMVMRNGKSVHRSTRSIFRRPGMKKISKTMTNDNGYEFIYSRRKKISKQLGMKVYFTDPGAPWQRGTVENTIGLLREYLPKKKDLTPLSYYGLKYIEQSLNNRPRKVLNYKTPSEIFHRNRRKILGRQS